MSCLRVPGTSNSYASSPDSAATSITGDIDLRIFLALDTWVPAVNGYWLLSKWDGPGGQRSYALVIDTDGKPYFYGSNDGAATVSGTEVGGNFSGQASGSALWVRATFRDSDNRIQFFTSSNGTTWAQLGADGTANLAGLKDGTAPVEIGSFNTGSAGNFSGKIFRAQIRNNIADDGTGIVFDADFAAVPKNSTTFVERSSNTATVTINGSAAVVATDRAEGTGQYLTVGNGMSRSELAF